MGRLHVGWKTSVGEAGSVQSQPVMQKTDQGRDVTVTIGDLPKEISCGTPFVANVKIVNNSARNLQLQLQFRKEDMGGLFCHSLSHQVVGLPLAANSLYLANDSSNLVLSSSYRRTLGCCRQSLHRTFRWSSCRRLGDCRKFAVSCASTCAPARSLLRTC